MSKVGRNDPCPCGSGKKYKHCHGAVVSVAPVAAGGVAGALAQSSGESVPVLMQRAYQHHVANRLTEAEKIYREVLEREPTTTEATHMIGLLQHQAGRHQHAVEMILGAISESGGTAMMYNNLAEAYSALQCMPNAIANYRKAILFDPDYADAFNNLGVALTRTSAFTEAEAALRRAAKLNPRSINAYTNLGNLYQLMERRDDAISEYRRALAIDAKDAETHNNLANSLKDLGRLDQAILHYKLALAANPRYAIAANNYGAALQAAGRMDEAMKAFAHALMLVPGSPDVLVHRAVANHLSGNIIQGWDDYEQRFLRTAGRPERRHADSPPWRGKLNQGESLLVWGEQGVGDEIWIAGMIDDLVAGPAKDGRVLFECSHKLAHLFQRSFPGVVVVGRREPPDERCVKGVNFQIAGGSLGRILRPGLDSFPSRRSYLEPSPFREKHWKEMLRDTAPGLNVGISWRSANARGERALSCVDLAHWGGIFQVPGVNFMNLQYDECEAELAEAESRFGIRIRRYPELDMFDDLDDTAAMMRSLDLVISAPTTVAFLAAALGVDTWQFHYGPDWRSHGQDRIPWFPAMREYVRLWSESRESLMGRIANDFAALVAGRAE